MFDSSVIRKKFDYKVWLATPTMHGEEIKYVQEAYDTNWMSTVGANINELEKIAAEQAGVKYAVALSCCTATLHLCCKLAGERLYGKACFFCCQQAIKYMRMNGGGSIVLTGSAHAWGGQKDRTAYACSKGVLRILNEHIAHQYATENMVLK